MQSTQGVLDPRFSEYTQETHPGLPKEIITALREAKTRGLPDGWTCVIDKRNRRKWTAPNGRSCDSIPKALAISVELGLLPPDTVIATGKRKRIAKSSKDRRPKKKKPPAEGSESKVAAAAAAVASKNSVHYEDSEEEEEDDEPPPEPLDPEVTLDGLRRSAMPTTVHWDPDSVDGAKVGWRVRMVLSDQDWVDGRVVRYDPHTHKHKIQLLAETASDGAAGGGGGEDNDGSELETVWLWLRNEQHNLHLATRIVWAHVKGYAWWPAWVMESSVAEDRKDGYVRIEFFGTGEVSTLRDTNECIRPFSPDTIDPVVAKHKKKRNSKAFALACAEWNAIVQARNEAAVFYATKAINMANQRGGLAVLGKRVQFHRSDVNYPYGDTVTGTVRRYSTVQKKWLIQFEMASNKKYSAAWINLQSKECALKILDKKKIPICPEDLVPYVYGFKVDDPPDAAATDATTDESSTTVALSKLLTDCCHGCVEYLKKDDNLLVCDECDASFHTGCFDPPLSADALNRMAKDGLPLLCSRCIPCMGCYEKDICFGSHVHVPPKTLSFRNGKALELCSMCKDAYEAERFCPNCAHSWDDVKYQKVRRQIEWGSTSRGGGRKHKAILDSFEDSAVPLTFGSFSGDDVLPKGAKVDPTLYFPETAEWGYTEVDMLVCDQCNIWVHAGCSGISEDEYMTTSDGDHPIYSKEFLCRVCCKQRCKDLIVALEGEDTSMLFALPVSEKVAPNYRDVIKKPMDLQTMLEKAESEDYLNYAWVREMFELMVLNALTFNRHYTKVWHEAKRYYRESLKKVFAKLGKAAPSGMYHQKIEKSFAKAREARKQEEERVQLDDSVEKKDLVAGSVAITVTLSKLRDAPPDQESCVSFAEATLKPIDAFYCSWMDACYSCGSSGASDTMLFCVDCGEAFHSFCANAPVHSMTAASVAGWRCPNCKICEISGDVPQDDSRMIFCEMCDRAFSLDLLDPPLKNAPSGLWICGQCVDCKCCGNTSEPEGPSLRHWSRDPEKCYRCGGCAGLVHEYTQEMNCTVCTKLLRMDDEDFVECDGCKGNVHADCDPRALDYSALQELASRAQKAQKTKNDKFDCQACFQKQALEPQAVGTPSPTNVDGSAVATEKPPSNSGHNTVSTPRSDDVVKLAEPLCGWSGQSDAQTKWNDPRECSLCHLCGDDDAGFADGEPTKEEAASTRLGRLLPMADGYWVHASCALWSSEVWEGQEPGMINAMEKARSRGAQLKCFGCGRHGATAGCNKSNCSFNYHFPCAKACGAVFTASQQMFCVNHKASATSILARESCEFMKPLMLTPEKKPELDSADMSEADLCSRVGSLVIHSLGAIEQRHDGFHSENYITPPGYTATRIFWSTVRPRARTVYILKIEQPVLKQAVFSILPGDNPSAKITGSSAGQVYMALMDRVRKVNSTYFSQGDLLSKLPMIRRTRRKTYGLNGTQFFGFGVDHVRKALEIVPGVEAVVAPLSSSSPKYRFCFSQPTVESIMDLQRKRAAVTAEQALENSSGCARTEGIKAVARSGGSGRITRALVRSAATEEDTSTQTTKKGEAFRADKQAKYRRMKAVPIGERLVARRSHIHGWGLFTKVDIGKDDPVTEYMGETIRQPVADMREKAYEISGEGSCYMFRLDQTRIVDASKIGCMARFMNHCCDPCAYAKVIAVDTDLGPDKKIVVFANRDIAAGEEITYDYKFPVEDGSLRCTCGAPNCIGRLN